MTKIGNGIIAALMLGIMVAGMSGCKKKEGPMERAGQKMDKAAEKAGQQIDKATEKTGEAIKKTGEKIEDSVK